MEHRSTERLTKERLKELAKDPQVTVYEYNYEQVEPLPMAQVQEYARKIYLWRCQYQRNNKPYNEEKAREALLAKATEESETMHRFCTYTHKPIFDHLTKTRAGIKEFRNVLEMIEVKDRILNGESEEKLLGAFKSKVLQQYTKKKK